MFGFNTMRMRSIINIIRILMKKLKTEKQMNAVLKSRKVNGKKNIVDKGKYRKSHKYFVWSYKLFISVKNILAD